MDHYTLLFKMMKQGLSTYLVAFTHTFLVDQVAHLLVNDTTRVVLVNIKVP